MQSLERAVFELEASQVSSALGSIGVEQIWRTQISDVNCARSLISQGHCTLQIPSDLSENFWRMVNSYSDISNETKVDFSFPERTDGFLPFGMERSRLTNRVDLCERFCFRQKFHCDHLKHSFTESQFYHAAAASETVLSSIAELILGEIWLEFESNSAMSTRHSSYMQFCSYDSAYRRTDREYLQDRHEDGNLITLAMASRDGLVIYPNGVPQLVQLDENEIIVFTGSLLTTLSDGRIPSMDHSVLNPPANVSRSSLVYFALPEPGQTYRSLVDGNDLNLEAIVNELHQAFGNHPFTDARSPR